MKTIVFLLGLAGFVAVSMIASVCTETPEFSMVAMIAAFFDLLAIGFLIGIIASQRIAMS
jgi:heme/copper-type cytochrome/quinol oxidase subunit 1